MTALQLYKFIQDNGIEWHWFNEHTDEPDVFICLRPWDDVKSFIEMMGPNIFEDEGWPCTMKYGYLVIEMGSICEWHGFSLFEVFDKEESK